jgi:PAS domain S-box-containing protein
MMIEKLYFDASSEFLVSLSSDNRITNANLAFSHFVASAPSSLIGQPILSFLSEEAEAGKFLEGARTGEKQVFTWKTNTTTSQPLRFKMSLRSPEGLILKLEDPGALNNKWGKKIANEQILQLLLNLIPFPLFVKNNVSEYALLNQAQADLFGLSMEEMLGKSDDVFIEDTKELQLVRNSDSEVLNSFKKVTLTDQQFTTPNGKMYILETIKVPFINDITGEANILGVSIDLTEKKLAEAKLLKSNLERDQFIERVTKDLTLLLQPLLDQLSASKSEKTAELTTNISKMNVLMKEMSSHS